MSEGLASLDVSALEALAKVEAEAQALRDLREKAALRRDKEVEVYTRVIADYEQRLTKLLDEATSTRQLVRDDLRRLDALHHHYSDALNRATLELHECEFRHEIGEFSAEEFRRCQQSAEQAIARQQAELESARTLRRRYLEVLPEEPAATPTPQATPIPVPAPPVAAAPAAVEPAAPARHDTVFLRAPAADDFQVPARGRKIGEAEEFGTVSVTGGILIEDRAGLPGTHYRLGIVTTIGRTFDNKIVVPVKEVSRRHAEIVAEEHDYVLRDLDSPNGTFVNGARIVEHRLKEGDKLTVGGKVFLFKQQ